MKKLLTTLGQIAMTLTLYAGLFQLVCGLGDMRGLFLD